MRAPAGAHGQQAPQGAPQCTARRDRAVTAPCPPGARAASRERRHLVLRSRPAAGARGRGPDPVGNPLLSGLKSSLIPCKFK